VVFRYQPNWISAFNTEEALLFIHLLNNIGQSAELTYKQVDSSGSNFTVIETDGSSYDLRLLIKGEYGL
jgi:hypothetical protein